MAYGNIHISCDNILHHVHRFRDSRLLRKEREATIARDIRRKLKSDIGFLLLPIGEILRGGAQQFGSSLAELIEASARLLGEGKPLSEAELFERWQTRLLLHDEKLFICRFFSMLGRSDEKTQLENIENYCERFKQRESECQNERKRYSPMFRKLGFLSGLAICLFLL